jgi:hypothetical protein
MGLFFWIYGGKVMGVGSTPQAAEARGLSCVSEWGDETARAIMGNEHEKWPAALLASAKSSALTIEYKAYHNDPATVSAVDAILLDLFGATDPIEAGAPVQQPPAAPPTSPPTPPQATLPPIPTVALPSAPAANGTVGGANG